MFTSFMDYAIIEAEKALKKKEIPVGAVIYDKNNKKIIAKSHNTVIYHNNSLMHAEMNAINQAMAVKKDKYLINCDIYITLEPCMMCFQAIKISRIDNIYFLLYNHKYGYISNSNNIATNIYQDISDVKYKEKYIIMLSNFFKNKND